VFSSLLLALGHADAMITGTTRPFAQTMKEIRRVLGPKPGHLPFGIHLLVGKNQTVFLADTTVNERPTAEELADIAIETADVTLMRNDLMSVADAVSLSRATVAKIRQNLFFAFVYNVLGIPLAAAGMLNPVIAGAAMALSSVSVVTNSLLLKRWRPGA